MSIEYFENLRWRNRDSWLGFNHESALKMISGGSILDLGCGDGTLLDFLKSRNIHARGLDISQEAVNKCKLKGLDVEHFDFSDGKLPYENDSFDYVIMLDVLEHLYDPAKLLNEAKRVTKKFVILSVPNFSSLPARLQVVLGKVPENNRRGKGHVYWFNWDVLKKMLDGHNLDIVALKCRTFWQNKFAIGTLSRFLMRKLPNLFALTLVVKAVKKENQS